MGGEGVPTLDGGGCTYHGWGRGYLPWMRGGVPTLDRGGGTYLRWGKDTYLGWGDTYPGQVVLRAICLLRLAGGLSCLASEYAHVTSRAQLYTFVVDIFKFHIPSSSNLFFLIKYLHFTTVTQQGQVITLFQHFFVHFLYK